MTARELINALLDTRMDAEVVLETVDPKRSDCSGVIFHIDGVGDPAFPTIHFTDWRDEKKNATGSKPHKNSEQGSAQNGKGDAMEEIKETNTDKEKELTCMEFYENMVDIAREIPGKDVMNSVTLQSIAYSLAKIGDALYEKEGKQEC